MPDLDIEAPKIILDHQSEMPDGVSFNRLSNLKDRGQN
jgi:hypothetical protein